MELLEGSSSFASQSVALSRIEASIPAIAVYARQKSAAKLTVVCLCETDSRNVKPCCLSLSSYVCLSVNMYSCC